MVLLIKLELLQSSLAKNLIPHLARQLLASLDECPTGTNPCLGTFTQALMEGTTAKSTNPLEQDSDLSFVAP